MNVISRSIRNKLLVICGGGTFALLLAALVGLGVEWSAIETLSGDITRAEALAIRNATLHTLLLTGAAFAVVVAIAFGLFLWALRRTIIGPALRLSDDLERLAGGDFRHPVTCTTRDELGAIARSAERIRSDLGALVSQLKQSVQSLVEASGVVGGESQRVAGASSAQNDAASSTVASIEDMTSAIRMVADNAGNAAHQTDASLDQSVRAQTHLTEVRDSINRTASVIDEVSGAADAFVDNARQIAAMTREVREIADQTNLLALNAAIEAARAGEQGRGFAVVADEVRKLAEKSASAAREIDDVTERLELESQAVDEGIRAGVLALDASQTRVLSVADVLERACDAAVKAAEGVDGIAAAISSQRSAIDEISGHAGQLSTLAQETLTSVEAGAQASGRLNAMARDLRSSVERFRLA